MRVLIRSIKQARKEFAELESQESFVKLIRLGRPNTTNESFVGRLLVARLAKVKEVDLNGFLTQSLKTFAYRNFFWSISHKADLVVAAIDKQPIGVDIEIVVAKNKNLFKIFSIDEWIVLGRKSWKNFYTGWTAKEACIKKLSLNLSDIDRLRISKRVGSFIFLKFELKSIKVRTKMVGRTIVSVSQ